MPQALLMTYSQSGRIWWDYFKETILTAPRILKERASTLESLDTECVVSYIVG